MRWRTALIPLLACGALAPAVEREPQLLDIEAEPPVVTISRQPADRHFLRLPTLEYRFRIEARCETGWQPEAFALNVADSRLSLSGSELNAHADDAKPLSLSVPARQIAPVPVAGFCVIAGSGEGSPSGPEEGAKKRLRIGGALSARASLICRSGDASDVTYAARALDVILDCEPGPGPAVDQAG